MSTPNHFDLIVIGAGNAGLAAANIGADRGRRVAIVESRDVGGTCPLRGCVPKKVLVAAAEVMDVIERAHVHGIEVGRPRLDWGRLIARERGFVEGVSQAFEASLADRGIELLRGRARFVDRNAIEVAGRRLSADKLVVATGSKPRPLAVDGSEHLVTSDDLLEMRDRPHRLVFVGAGVIGFELGHVLRRAGTEVTLIELGERVLPRFDPELVDRLVEHSRSIGMRVLTGTTTEAVVAEGEGFVVRVRNGERRSELPADVVANATGRIADLDDLDLPAAGIALDRGRPRLDAFFRAEDNPDVYFAGDAVPQTAQLSPLATAEGRAVARHALGDPRPFPDPLAIPAAVYAIPSLAMVGHTEASARAAGLAFDVKRNDMLSWRSARTHAEPVAFAKVLIGRDDAILGAHLFGHEAPELVHAFAFAIAHRVSATALRETIYTYPTFHADLPYLV